MQDGGFQENQDDLEVCHHHHPYHPHHTFSVYAHAIQTWLYRLTDQNDTNIPASIILSRFSNYQILGQLMEQPLQGPKASSHFLRTCPGSQGISSGLAKPHSAMPLRLPVELGTTSLLRYSQWGSPGQGARRVVFRCGFTPNKHNTTKITKWLPFELEIENHFPVL